MTGGFGRQQRPVQGRLARREYRNALIPVGNAVDKEMALSLASADIWVSSRNQRSTNTACL